MQSAAELNKTKIIGSLGRDREAAAAVGGDSKTNSMKATLKGRFDGDKASAATTLAVTAAGDLRFKASATEATFTNGPSLSGLTLTVEKPGAFLVDVKPHNKVQ
jgi:hypothetical protein